jgi:peptidoglycan/LPS O-acetylase OafA/YrhL
LHLLRFLSAIIVFAHHASYDRFGGEWISWLADHGHEAVVVFFVLSGYVVTFTTDTKEKTLSLYAASRLSRLWSVVLPALLLTLGFDWLGQKMYPVLYSGLLTDGWRGYLASGVFANEIWSLQLTPGSNLPFWSLSYEFFYYVVFGAYLFFPGSRVWTIACMIFAGPKIMLLFPAWAMGSLAYRFGRSALTPVQALSLAVFGGLLALALGLSKFGNLYVTWRIAQLLGETLFAHMGHAAAFLSDNLIALGVAMHLLGAAHLLQKVEVPALAARIIQKIADSTFCIYLLHYPALYFFTALSIFATGKLNGAAIGLASLAVGFLLTPPTEWLRRHGRDWLLRSIGHGKAPVGPVSRPQ